MITFFYLQTIIYYLFMCFDSKISFIKNKIKSKNKYFKKVEGINIID